MKLPLLFFLVLTMACSCNKSDKTSENNENATGTETGPQPPDSNSSFEYVNYPIRKNHLGSISIGMTISEAEKEFSGLRKESGNATSFGYGGGSMVYLYYDNYDLVFGLIPALNTETILLIIAVDSKLQAVNGLRPKTTVREISKVYSNMMVHQDLMNGWEYMTDSTNQLEIVFMTDDGNRVGKYPENNSPSQPINLDIESDWITIK